jgi:hypothetical protein
LEEGMDCRQTIVSRPRAVATVEFEMLKELFQEGNIEIFDEQFGRLVEAKHQLQLRRVMARWSRYDLIAIDEVGYVPLAEVGAEFLFQVIAERAERTAVIVTTNLLCGAPHNAEHF